MFIINITSALLIYFGLLIFLILGLWFWTHFKERRQEAPPPYYALAICEYCSFSYLAPQNKPINKCPQCQGLNKENYYVGKKS